MKKIGIVVFIVLNLQYCAYKNSDKPTVNLNAAIDTIFNDYQNQFEVKNIDVNFQAAESEKDSVNIIEVIFFDARRLPKSDPELESLSLEIACKVYQNVINKNDFGKINIDFVFNELYLSELYRRIRYEYSYADIENNIATHH